MAIAQAGSLRPDVPVCSKLRGNAAGEKSVKAEEQAEEVRKIAVIGNYPPRQCGIATFTSDLVAALSEAHPEGECFSVAMNDCPEGYLYPGEVRFEINQRILSDYGLAADYLNMNRVDVVCLQHEFGIFGGEDGAHALELLGNLRMPVATTLHTVVLSPTPGQRAITRRLAQLSDRLVVMSHRAREILMEVYAVAAEKIVLIHHGIPDVPFVDPSYFKDQYAVEGRKVILTFGLISPGKGIEYMINALPAVIRAHPDVVYIVLGATHPHLRSEEGESYRLSLQRRARELNVEDYLIFHNRFVELEELCEFLGAADLYVTPYLNKEQIVSGTLAYALGSGKATISTPYWYAEEMLAEGRGRIVPFRDSEALAAQVIDLLTHETERHAMRKRAYMFCREMIWKVVAGKYLDLLVEIKRERESAPRPVSRSKTVAILPSEAPQPKLDHIIRLTDDVGILQHAKFIVPDRSHGYCTDDNARALIAVLMAQDLVSDNGKLIDLACVYLSFLQHAFDEDTGRFRNFLGYDRRWLEELGSEDCHGRAIWGAGLTIVLADSDYLRAAAQGILEKAVPALLDFTSPRAWAFALVGLNGYLIRFGGNSEVRRVRDALVERLTKLYEDNAREDWPWIEDVVAYANGKIPHALIFSGRALGRPDLVEMGLRSLTWLLKIQTDSKGHLVPVGNKGWYPRGGEKARFDQQPIEASNLIEACREAYDATNDPVWLTRAQLCLDWFMGRNDLNAQLYDFRSGGCCDGLHADGPNHNQGAESTLVAFLSLLNLQYLTSRQISIEATAGTTSNSPSEAVVDVP